MHQDIRKLMALAAATVLLGLTPASLYADTGTRWGAFSKTAMSITGDIIVSDNAITFANGKKIEIEPTGKLTGYGGVIYRLKVPSDPVLLNGNRLCGEADPVSYIVLSKPSEKSLSMDVFNQAKAPQGETDATSCGGYYYER